MGDGWKVAVLQVTFSSVLGCIIHSVITTKRVNEGRSGSGRKQGAWESNIAECQIT
jgi:hypothetical protein